MRFGEKIALMLFFGTFMFCIYKFLTPEIDMPQNGPVRPPEATEPVKPNPSPVKQEVRLETKPEPFWVKQYDKFNDIRAQRFGVARNPGEFGVARQHKAKQTIKRNIMAATVRETFRRLPHIKTRPEVVDLLVETAVVESRNGYFLVGKLASGKESGDYGVFQIRVETARDTLNWLKAVHRDVYDCIQALYEDGKSIKWNLTHNVPFSAAMAVTYYWRRDPHRLQHGIGTVEQRAEFWLDEYNTKFGAGTKQAYLDRVKNFKS